MTIRRFMPSAVVGVLLLVVLSGCVDSAGEGGDDPRPAPRGAVAHLDQVLTSLPEPEFNRVAAVDWWADYVTTYTKRDNGLPNNIPAANALAAEMRASGFEVQILSYETNVGAGAQVQPATIRVVEAIKPGTQNPDHWLALISHFDTHANTIEGAYDDGSGVAVEVSICKLLAAVPTNKTIACLFFDAEERGLVGSREYVADKVTEGDEDFVFDQGFGYDMVGLNWPGYSAWKLYAMAGLDAEGLIEFMPDHLAFLNQTLMGFLGQKLNVTSEGVEILDVHDRNSDEQNFKRQGIPVVRFAGGRRAADYPQYHLPQDTVQYVYEYAGGRENFEKGYEMVVLASYYTILAYDQFDPKALPDLSGG